MNVSGEGLNQKQFISNKVDFITSTSEENSISPQVSTITSNGQQELPATEEPYQYSTDLSGESTVLNNSSSLTITKQNETINFTQQPTKPSDNTDEVVNNVSEPSTKVTLKDDASIVSNNQEVLTRSSKDSALVEKKATDYTDSHIFWDYQWDMKYVTNNGESYKLYQPSKNVSIGVVDSGVMEEHPDLVNSLGSHLKNFVPKGGFDNTEPDEDGQPSFISDKMGHGTEVAGQITANGNILGVAPGITINIYRVFGESFSKPEWIAAAIKKAADDGNRIITVSSGQYLMISGAYEDGTNDYQDYLKYKAAVDYATKTGSIVVAALGNDGLNIQDNQTMIDYLKNYRNIRILGKIVDVPSTFDNVVAVGGIDSFGNISDFSNIALGAIFAPAGTTANLKKYGEDDFVNQGYYLKDWIFTTTSTGWYQYVYGNSFATPKVAAALALVADKYKVKDPKELKKYLFSHSPEFNGIKVLSIVDLLHGKIRNSDLSTDKDNALTNRHKSVEKWRISDFEGFYMKKVDNRDKIAETEVVSVDYSINQKTNERRNLRGTVVVRGQSVLPTTGDREDGMISFLGLGVMALPLLVKKRKH